MEDILILIVSSQITWWPSLFPISTLAEFLIPIGPLLHLVFDFIAW
jgi:hypothetical protein